MVCGTENWEAREVTSGKRLPVVVTRAVRHLKGINGGAL